MKHKIGLLREAYRFYNSDRDIETVIALILIVLVVAPILWRWFGARE